MLCTFIYEERSALASIPFPLVLFWLFILVWLVCFVLFYLFEMKLPLVALQSDLFCSYFLIYILPFWVLVLLLFEVIFNNLILSLQNENGFIHGGKAIMCVVSALLSLYMEEEVDPLHIPELFYLVKKLLFSVFNRYLRLKRYIHTIKAFLLL